MTISNTTSRVTHHGNDVAESFSFDFKIFADSDLVVTYVDSGGTETDLVLDTDYSVTTVDGVEGGSIDFPLGGSAYSTLATGEDLVLYTDIPLLQSVDLPNQGPFHPDVHETFFDKIIRIAQQIMELIGRQPAVPVSVTLSSNELPAPSAGNAIGWNADGDGFANITDLNGTAVSPFMETVLDDTTAAAALTTLGAASLTGNNVLNGTQTINGATTFNGNVTLSGSANSIGAFNLTGNITGGGNYVNNVILGGPAQEPFYNHGNVTGTATLNASVAPYQKANATAGCTYTLTLPATANVTTAMTLHLTNGDVGTQTFTGADWGDAGAPALGSDDFLEFWSDDAGVTVHGVHVKKTT